MTDDQNKTVDYEIPIWRKYTLSVQEAAKYFQYERFARQLYAFDNHAQAYDILYFRSGTADSSPILHEISRGEELYARS